MDIHRYFHPHHNPRLIHSPLRLQELNELEQAAVELKRALVRAQIRLANEPVGVVRDEHLSEIIVALDFAVESLQEIGKAFPEDELDTLLKMVEERRNAPGWEGWARLLQQRLELIGDGEKQQVASGASRNNPS